MISENYNFAEFLDAIKEMDWQAFGAISNAVLVAALVIVTIYYAWQTHKQAKYLQRQIDWDRTYRPRLNAYERFIDVMSKRLMDTTYIRYSVVPQLGLVQPYASVDVKTKARELFEYAEDHRHNNEGRDPADITSRINAELKPIIIGEMETITAEHQLE